MFDQEPDGEPHGECAAEIGRLKAEVEHQHGCVRHYMERSDTLAALRPERDRLKAGHDKMCRDLGYLNESPEHGPGYEVPSQQGLTDLIVGDLGYHSHHIGELESIVEAWKNAAQAHGTARLIAIEAAQELEKRKI